ncbi:MAG: hypothetical protein FD129_2546, partial [bacterium]
SRLPAQRVRCFFRRRVGNDLGFEEVILRLDTLFADLDAGQVHLTWRGVTRASTMKLKEFEEFFVLVEPIQAPLGHSTDDYRRLYEERREEERKEFEIPPVIIEPPSIPVISPLSTAWADRLDEKIKTIRAEANADQLKPMPVTGPTGAKLPPFAVPPMPPIPKTNAEAKAIMAADQAGFAGMDARIPDAYPFPDLSMFDDMDDPIADMAAEEEAKEADRPAAVDDHWTRERVIARLAEGGGFVRQDLARLDLSNLCFDGTAMARADLDGCDLTGSTFVGTNLSGATLRACRLAGALLERAILDDTDLAGIQAAGIDFTGASMQECDTTGADLTGARLDRIRASRAIFGNTRLAGASFE